jgi:hypothetical protein
VKKNLLKINKPLFLALFASVIWSLPVMAMQETDAYKAFRDYMERQSDQNTDQKKTLFSWLKTDNHFNFKNKELIFQNSNSKTYQTYIPGDKVDSCIKYTKKEKNGHKKCTLRHPGLFMNIPDHSTDDEKTNELDTHLARLLRKLVQKKYHEISFSQDFKEAMNRYQKSSSKTLFNYFADLATCVKKDDKELYGEDDDLAPRKKEICTVTFNENEK